MGPERIELSAKERERLKVLQQVEEGHLQQIEAARRLHVTDRQARRLRARLRSQGDRGIVHRLRGRRSMMPAAESGTGWWSTIPPKKTCIPCKAGWSVTDDRCPCTRIKTACL
jgi:hypothetical protein